MEKPHYSKADVELGYSLERAHLVIDTITATCQVATMTTSPAPASITQIWSLLALKKTQDRDGHHAKLEVTKL